MKTFNIQFIMYWNLWSRRGNKIQNIPKTVHDQYDCVSCDLCDVWANLHVFRVKISTVGQSCRWNHCILGTHTHTHKMFDSNIRTKLQITSRLLLLSRLLYLVWMWEQRSAYKCARIAEGKSRDANFLTNFDDLTLVHIMQTQFMWSAISKWERKRRQYFEATNETRKKKLPLNSCDNAWFIWPVNTSPLHIKISIISHRGL